MPDPFFILIFITVAEGNIRFDGIIEHEDHLGYIADMGKPACIVFLDILAVQQDLSFTWMQQTDQHVNSSGLACTGRTDDADALAVGNHQAGIHQSVRICVGIAVIDMLHLNLFRERCGPGSAVIEQVIRHRIQRCQVLEHFVQRRCAEGRLVDGIRDLVGARQQLYRSHGERTELRKEDVGGNTALDLQCDDSQRYRDTDDLNDLPGSHAQNGLIPVNQNPFFTVLEVVLFEVAFLPGDLDFPDAGDCLDQPLVRLGGQNVVAVSGFLLDRPQIKSNNQYSCQHRTGCQQSDDRADDEYRDGKQYRNGQFRCQAENDDHQVKGYNDIVLDDPEDFSCLGTEVILIRPGKERVQHLPLQTEPVGEDKTVLCAVFKDQIEAFDDGYSNQDHDRSKDEIFAGTGMQQSFQHGNHSSCFSLSAAFEHNRDQRYHHGNAEHFQAGSDQHHKKENNQMDLLLSVKQS